MSGLSRLVTAAALALLIAHPHSASAADKWATPSFASGWKDFAREYRPVSAVKSGNVITVSGLAARTNGKWGHIATLPSDMRPKNRLIFNVNTQDRTARVDVLPNGQIHFITGRTAQNWVSLDGISFITGKTYPLKLTPGWRNYGNGYTAANELKVGNTVTLGGLVVPGAGNVIATLPAHLRPAKRHIFNLNSHDKTSRVDVLPDGRVIWVHRAAARGWVSLDGIRFERKPGRNLQPVNGWKNYQDGYATATATRVGNRISVNGLLRAGRWDHMANLPKGMCPEKRLIFNLNNHDRSSRVTVQPDCRIFWSAGGKNHGWLSLEGISFVIGKPAGTKIASQPKTPAQPSALSWVKVPGGATDIAVGANGAVWVVGGNSLKTGNDIYQYIGHNKWRRMPGAATRIAVDPKGNAWIVDKNRKIHRWDGGAWHVVPGAANDIAIGADGTVWVIGADKRSGGFTIWRYLGNNRWKNIPGDAARIAVDPKGNAWVVNTRKEIFRYDGRKWNLVPGGAIDVGIGANGSVWVIGADYAPYQWNGKTWVRHTGAITGISVDPKGYPWAVNGAKSIYADRRSKSHRSPPKPAVAPLSFSTSSVEQELKKNPAFSKASLSNTRTNNGILTARMKVGSANASVVAWSPASGKPPVSALLLPRTSIRQLLPKLPSANKMAGYTLTDVVVFTVPLGAQNPNQKISALPRSVSDMLKKTDPAFKDNNATIALNAGMTYFGAVSATGIVKTAFDMMKLKQPMSLAGSLAVTDYAKPQNEVTLTARLKKDPLTTVLGPIQVIKVAKSAQPSVYVSASGSAAIEVGYSSTFNIFNQVLDGRMYFAASGQGASSETKVGIGLSRKGRWHEPHLFAPVKARNITLNDADIVFERVIKKTGSSTVISVITSSTKIHSTTYRPAAFSFTLEGTSNLPKAVFVDLATQKLTVLQMAELGEVALQLTPQGQLAAAASPYKSSTIMHKLQLDKLPLGKVVIRNPKIYLGTVDAVVPALKPVPNPVLPPISGAGVHLRGQLEAFGKRFGNAEFQLDFNGLRSDTNVNALTMGPFKVDKARFKIDARPGRAPESYFSGDAKFSGFTLASARFGLSKTRFSYSFDTGCIPKPPTMGIFKFVSSGSSKNLQISGSMFGAVPEPKLCLKSPLEMLEDALKAGKQIVALGDKLVTDISIDTWKGLADSAGGVLKPSTVKNAITTYGSPDKAATQLADTGKKAAKKLGDSIKSIFGSGKSSPKPRYKNVAARATDSRNRDGKCFADDDWSIQYANCWRRGHELVRLASNQNLCLTIRKRIREQGKAIEVWNCDGGWHQQWRWVRNIIPLGARGAATMRGLIGHMGTVRDGWKGDWCFDRKGDTKKPKDGQRLESKECRGELRQLFYRDTQNRIVHYTGRCLQAVASRHESEVKLYPCSGSSLRKWTFKKGSSFLPMKPGSK